MKNYRRRSSTPLLFATALLLLLPSPAGAGAQTPREIFDAAVADFAAARFDAAAEGFDRVVDLRLRHTVLHGVGCQVEKRRLRHHQLMHIAIAENVVARHFNTEQNRVSRNEVDASNCANSTHCKS